MSAEGAALVALPGHSIALESSRQLGKEPEDSKRANVTAGKKSYKPVSLCSITGKVMEQLILGDISKYLKDKKAIWNSPIVPFTKGKSYMTNWIVFCKEGAGWC